MLTEFEKEVHELVENITRGFGLDSLSGKIFITLFMEPAEMSLEDLTKETGYSLSTLSTKMNVMVKIGMIKRTRKPGSKKIYFYMNKSMKQMAIDKINISLQVEIIPLKNQLPTIINKHRKRIMGSKDEKQKKQLKIMENCLDQMVKFEKIMKDLIKNIEEM